MKRYKCVSSDGSHWIIGLNAYGSAGYMEITEVDPDGNWDDDQVCDPAYMSAATAKTMMVILSDFEVTDEN